MKLTDQKFRPKAKPSKPRRAPRAQRRTVAAAVKPELSHDLAERERISKTLDVEAFRRLHRRNTKSNQAHWETPED
jgi:hypothetical protein